MDKRPPDRSQDKKGRPRIDFIGPGIFFALNSRFRYRNGGRGIKGFVIAAPMSGSGKTTVSLGLMAAEGFVAACRAHGREKGAA